MICALLYHILLFPAQDTAWLANTRQLMTDIRQNRIMSDTLFISREAYPLRTDYCDYLLKDTIDFTAAELQEFHAPTHDTPLKTWTPDLVGGPAWLVKSDSLIAATKVMGPNKINGHWKEVRFFCAGIS